MRIDWTPSSSRISPSSSNVGFEPFSRRSNEIRSQLASLRALRLGRERLSSSILRKARRTFVASKYRSSSSVYTQQRIFLSSRAGTSWHTKLYAVLENNRYERKRMNRNLLRETSGDVRERETRRTFCAKSVITRFQLFAAWVLFVHRPHLRTNGKGGVFARKTLIKTTAFEGALANNSISDDW